MTVSVDPPAESAGASERAVHEPYVSPNDAPRELTVRAVALGALLGIVFAASSVYLALKVGLTVSASIPIAVMSITIFRLFGRATILENNIVQRDLLENPSRLALRSPCLRFC
jgi:hypothetical protein